METALKTTFVSVDEYLSGEELSDVRHEYVAGVVYAMAGTSDPHNTIAGNFFAALHSHLRGSKCRLFISDIKAYVQTADYEIFYYPDVMVTCDARDTERHFKRYPTLIIEVLSDSTERIDRHEKFRNYTQIETLQEYVLVSQDKMEVTVFRRAQDWKAEIANRADQEIRLDSVQFKVQIGAIYEGVTIE
jgi:Uma2 family endonuclease